MEREESEAENGTSSTAKRRSVEYLGEYSRELKRFKANDMAALLDSGDYSDVKIRVDGAEIPAHKNILSLCSPVWKERLQAPIDENNSSSILDCTDTDATSMRLVLKFMYTDGLDAACSGNLSNLQWRRLLVAADRYRLEQLQALCERRLQQQLSLDNAFECLLLQPRELRADKLRRAARELILENARKLCSQGQLKLERLGALDVELLVELALRLNDQSTPAAAAAAAHEPRASSSGGGGGTSSRHRGGGSSLQVDFEGLLARGEFSDFVIVVGEHEIRAHKLVLSARSSVFRAMFEHDMQESRQNRLVIADLELLSVQALLRFVYTNKLGPAAAAAADELADETSFELLYAADKYDLPELKELLQESMCHRLGLDNVIEYALVAAQFQAERLLEAARRFIRDRARLICRSSQAPRLRTLDRSILQEILLSFVQDVASSEDIFTMYI